MEKKSMARSVVNKLRKAVVYARKYGFTKMFVFALYSLFPKPFWLVEQYKVPVAQKDTELKVEPENREAYYVSLTSRLLDLKVGTDSRVQRSDPLKSIVWFVPDWSNVWGGGHLTLFRFANHIQRVHGVRNYLFTYDRGRDITAAELEDDLRRPFPNHKLKVIVNKKDIPRCNIAIATTWQSAYSVYEFGNVESKFYFMQDYESLFYPGGTSSMQANFSYTFGFKGVTGGTWLRECFESYGGKATNYVFSTDRDIFYPPQERSPVVKRIFFYGRPSTDRRAFELGIAALTRLNGKYPDIEIIIAGLSGVIPPPFPCTLLGNLSLEETGDLYRRCDIGLAFSGTNLSYLPVELMACGCPVVSNKGPHVEWYCVDGYNSVLSDPVPSEVLKKLEELILNPDLRRRVIEGGLETSRRTTWEKEIDKVFAYLDAER